MELIQKLLGEKRVPQGMCPEWFRRMREDYASTGQVRPEDLFRLMGDPSKFVDIGKPASRPPASS